MQPTIYNITLSNNGNLFIVSDIWITEDEGGLDRAICEAIYLARDSLGMAGDIEYISS